MDTTTHRRSAPERQSCTDRGEHEHGDRSECNPIIVADGGARCGYCGEVFDADAAPTTTIPSATLARCPSCERWSEVGR